jgi:hypothetical protein
MPQRKYYPRQNEESHNNYQDGQYPGKVKRSNGELNVQSRCHENENSSSSSSYVRGTKHAAMTQMPITL